jgi:hypothetical protein
MAFIATPHFLATKGIMTMASPKQRAQRIAELLHLSRNATWTTDQTLELSAAVKGQSTEILAMALLLFSGGLLLAARSATQLEREVVIAEAELDERGRLLQ